MPWPTVRLAADALGIRGLVWRLGLTGCHYVYPHLVGPGALRLRTAARRDAVTIPWSQVDTVRMRERGVEGGRALQLDPETESTLLVVVVVAVVGVVGRRTNVEITLREPLAVVVGGTSQLVHEMRLYADEPREVVAELRRAAASGAQRST